MAQNLMYCKKGCLKFLSPTKKRLKKDFLCLITCLNFKKKRFLMFDQNLGNQSGKELFRTVCVCVHL